MRHFYLVLAATTLISASACAQTTLREVDVRVRGVGSGTSYSSVIGKFGRPISKISEEYSAELSCTASDMTSVLLRYPGLTLNFLGDGSGKNLKVVEIVVTSDRWAASGIRVGARRAQIIRRFGEPNSRVRRGSRTIFHYVTTGNLGNVNLEFVGDRLIRILMSETLC